MRHAALIVLIASSGCLSQIIPSHETEQTPNPDGSANTETPPAPDPTAGDDGGTPLSGSDGGNATAFSLTIEAESMTLTAPMAVLSDPNASGGQYISTAAATTGGKATFSVTVPFDGTFALWGRTIGPTASNNSFDFSIDADRIDETAANNTCTIWDINTIGTTWTWALLNQRTAAGNNNLTPILSAGTHNFYINEREVLTQLDAILITSDLTYVPK
jgi:hypothetical protein